MAYIIEEWIHSEITLYNDITQGLINVIISCESINSSIENSFREVSGTFQSNKNKGEATGTIGVRSECNQRNDRGILFIGVLGEASDCTTTAHFNDTNDTHDSEKETSL